MIKLNFKHYFKNTDTKYYKPKYIIKILENILGNKLDNIKKEINNKQVVVSKEQITQYLEKKFEEEYPELKKKVESLKIKRSENIGKWTPEDFIASSQEFVDGLNTKRYYFEPYTLEYFKLCTDTLRNKALLLLSIIEKIGNKDCISIQDLMKDLDIQLDENGNILKEDIIRLITPTVYNINELNEIVSKANNLSTYLTFKMSKRDAFRHGESIYPTELLQRKDLYHDDIKGNVPLSNNQRAKLQAQHMRELRRFEYRWRYYSDVLLDD